MNIAKKYWDFMLKTYSYGASKGQELAHLLLKYSNRIGLFINFIFDLMVSLMLGKVLLYEFTLLNLALLIHGMIVFYTVMKYRANAFVDDKKF